MALWTIATATATVFKIMADGTRQPQAAVRHALRHLGERSGQGAQRLGDGAPADLLGASAGKDHLVFRARRSSCGFGRQLLDCVGIVFEYWHDYKAGKLSRETFIAWMARSGSRWK